MKDLLQVLISHSLLSNLYMSFYCIVIQPDGMRGDSRNLNGLLGMNQMK